MRKAFTQVCFRSATTGQFISKKRAKKLSKRTTVRETIKHKAKR